MKEELRLQRIEDALGEIKQLLNLLLCERTSNSAPETTAYLNVKQAARLLGVEPSTIYAKCQDGKLPHRRVGKYYKFTQEELVKWMKHPEIAAVDVDQYVDNYLQKNLFRG